MFLIDWPILTVRQLQAVNANENLQREHPEDVINPALTLADMATMRSETRAMLRKPSAAILDYVVRLAASVDPDYDQFHQVKRRDGGNFADLVSWGGCDRLNHYLLRAAAAVAVFTGSPCIEPHHVRFVFPDAARPHFKMSPKASFGKNRETPESFIEQILATVSET